MAYNNVNATFTKLKSGEWGVRVPYKVEAGQQISVYPQSGDVKQVVIEKVIWKGNGIWLCAIEQRKRPRTKRDAAWAEKTGQCRSCSNAYVDAPHHRAMEGYCGYCAFDEFDI